MTQLLVNSVPSCLGVSHTYDIAILFSVFDDTLSSFFLSLTPAELQFRATMRDAWASFIITGEPSLPSFKWPQYSILFSA